MKKHYTMLAVAGLAASLSAYAAVPTDAQPFQLVVPNLKSGLEINLEGLLLRPSNSTLGYGVISPLTPANTPALPIVVDSSQTLAQVNPDYNFGFRVGLGYIFPNSGNDVQINWTHFDHSTTDSVTAGAGEELTTAAGIVLPNFTNNPRIIPIDQGVNLVIDNDVSPTVSSTVNFKADAIDLDVGQYLDVGTRLRMRMFGGLRFARVETNQTDSAAFGVNENLEIVGAAPVLLGVGSYAETDSFNSKFTGVGPRFGIDTSYHIANCFGIVGHVAGALLVGKVDDNTNSDLSLNLDATPTGIDFGFPNGEIASIGTSGSSSETRVVPAFDAKLGLDYTYIFANQAQLSLEAGYQWTQYINAVDKLSTGISGSIFEPETLTPSNVITHTSSSVGFDGPYLTLSYKM